MDVDDPVAELADGRRGVVAVRREPPGVDGGAKHVRGVVADLGQHLCGRALGMILESEPHAVLAEHRGGPVPVGEEDLTHPAEHRGTDRVGDAAGGGQLVEGGADGARHADDPQPVAVERFDSDVAVLGRRPAPVEVRRPQVELVEAGTADGREHGVEPRLVCAQRAEGGVRRSVARPPLLAACVADLAGDVVGAHERDRLRQPARGGGGPAHLRTRWSSSTSTSAASGAGGCSSSASTGATSSSGCHFSCSLGTDPRSILV